MEAEGARSQSLRRVALFPLPSVVLFPRVRLPLHIFEERYREMTCDVLDSSGEMAMALLLPGFEMNYYGRPDIDDVVCVGQIVDHERLRDGRYNILLEGRTRARVVKEYNEKSYRIADLQPLQETEYLEIDLLDARERLKRLFTHTALAAVRASGRFVELLAGPTPTAVLADLIAFNLIEDVCFKQWMLREPDVVNRVTKLASLLEKAMSGKGPGTSIA